jgi:hypothetical protein
MSTQLTPPSIATVKAVVSFSRHFSADLIKLTSTTAAAIDDIPSLFIVFDGISYAGPDLMLNRVRELSQRIAVEGASITVVTGGTEDKPKSLQIKSGKSTIDFRLAAERSNDRIPAKFTGTFTHTIDMDRADLTAAIAGASSIGSKLLTFVGNGKSLVLTATSESETYTADLEDIATSSTFQYNYTVEYLHAIDKILPKSISSVEFSITAKGHMRVGLPTELKQITAAVFLLDVKNR